MTIYEKEALFESLDTNYAAIKKAPGWIGRGGARPPALDASVDSHSPCRIDADRGKICARGTRSMLYAA